MAGDRLQAQRFELKYQISEDLALAIRDFVSTHLDLDEYGASLPDWSYPVHSLYFDSDDLRLYHATINGDKNRYKLRARYYEDRRDAPVYLEIKRRMNSTISKKRAAVDRDALGEIVRGHLPGPERLFYHDAKQQEALQSFFQDMVELRAGPKTHVAYRREAWISPHDNSVRVTMDRDVLSEPHPCARLKTEMHDSRPVFDNQVILELKFTNRFPVWFREMVRIFNLMQCGAAKYADGVTKLGEQHVNRAFVYYPSLDESADATDRPSDTEEKADDQSSALFREHP